MSFLLPAFLQRRDKHLAALGPPLRPARVFRRTIIRIENDGLLVYAPNASRAVRIAWGRPDSVESVDEWDEATEETLECTAEGLIGLLRLFQHSWLLAVSKTSYVASMPTVERGQVRQLDDVLAVPLDRDKAIAMVKLRAAREQDSDSSYSASDADEAPLREYLGQKLHPTPSRFAERRGSDSRDRVFGLGAYFWRPTPSRQRDISVLAQTPGQSRQDLLVNGDARPPFLSGMPEGPRRAIQNAHSSSLPAPSPDLSSADGLTPELVARAEHDKAAREQLDAKIIKECIRDLRHGMYLSYDCSITRSTQWKAEKQAEMGEPCLNEPNPDKALIDREDVRFVWNRHLGRSLYRKGLHDYLVPVMQGFVRQESVSLSAADVLDLTMTVISRRSIERPGLRYQRRGINEMGNTANFVETEFVLELESKGNQRTVSSFVQLRGSIPLFWSQSPWSLKPVPVLEGSPAENKDGFARHFETLTSLYGPQVILNVAEQHGREGIIVSAYQRASEELSRTDVKHVAWDFHQECKGMRFENVSKLVSLVQPDMEQMASFDATASCVARKQSGTFRTNCMDCLDRTNVVQSALARKHLNRFLVAQQVALRPHEKLDMTFNDIWASNGDAISREYAGTSALKGDFVRSGKRNWRGMLNDATNSLARMWQNTISDFFKQSMIDYVLGINLGAFEEFQEKVATSDPGNSVRIAMIRSTAIETAASHVLTEGENIHAGWTLLAPTQAGSRDGPAFEEKVLLLTKEAIYACSYEYHLQKVRDFTRIPLTDVLGISYGPYILSTLSPFARDAKENAGFVITFHSGATEERSAAYSLQNQPSEMSRSTSAASLGLPTPPDVHELAFKVMRRDMVLQADEAAQDPTNIEPTAHRKAKVVVGTLLKACQAAGAASADGSDGFLREEAVISFEEAERNTSLMSRLKNSVQHAVWL